MNDFLKKFDWAMHVGGLAVVLASVFLAYTCLFRPLTEASAEASGRCGEIAELLKGADQLRAEQAELKRSLAKAQEEEEALLARVPDEAHEAAFLGQISRLAKEVDIELRDYRPGEIRPQPGCSAMEVSLTCRGDYGELCRFLDGVGRLPRLVHMTGLDIDGSHGPGDYTALLKLLIYFHAAESPLVTEPRGRHG